ncbi:type IV secretion system DNA-binding domain-containing protein [Bradyrhizobium sp. Tv2a-2]|uniref:type IV secretion system DNA-binding domain-containing protein n=1 Tax=Bradyrhizobium sp. Tv2a-2 TaxID=113395 RepID=UPI0004096C3A|nr:type IV secretion system DNA-binding domain-containing protein [Bradyrhizobium sp. Tv2a-2]
MAASTEITERHRSSWKAFTWGCFVFVAASAAGWVAAFDITRFPNSVGPFLSQSTMALTVLGRAMCEAVGFQLDNITVAQVLERGGLTLSFFGRVGIVFAAAFLAAVTIAEWRRRQTPRRLRTKWIDRDIPPWSEGKDAIANANSTLLAGIKRTGRGLEICPGIPLSKEQEARSLAVVGEPGSGKTVAFWQVIFQLLKRRCHIIGHDVKGDLTARWPGQFILLAPHDARSWGWAIGRDIVGTVLARELSTLLVAAAGNDPQWAEGAREILVGIIKTLQHERRTEWGWPDLKAALELDDAALKDFACRFHPVAKRFTSLDGDQNFTKNAGSYVSTLMAPINRLIEPLAAAWGGLRPQFQMSLTEWLDNPNPTFRTLILQRAPDLGALSTAWIGSAVQVIAQHLVGTRRDRNPGDQHASHPPDVWLLLDEFAQLGPISSSFLPLLEVGRSLGVRAMVGLQNFQQLSRIQGQHAPAELLQLIGTLVCFRLNPGADAKRVCEERLTTAPVRTWIANDKTGIKEPGSKEIRILSQDDLSRLEITRDGAQGYLLIGNAAFGLEWPFPNAPIQRDSSIRSAWIRSN